MHITSSIEDLPYWRLTVAAASVAFATYIISCLYAAITSPLKRIPGPWISLFTDRQLKSAGTAGKRIFYIDELHKKYGPIVRISPDEVTVFDIEAFRQIHAVSSGYTKSDFYTKLINFPVHSVFTLKDAKAHGVRRRLFAKGFSKSHVREHFEDVVRERVSLAVKKIVEDSSNHGGKVDVFKWWSLMGADIVGCLGFGESFGLLELGARTEYIEILELALIGNGIGAEHPWLRAVLARLPIKKFHQMFNSTNYILDYGMKAVANAKKAIREGRTNNLMSTVIEDSEKEGGGKAALRDIDIQVEATGLIFAGSGTTANTLSFAVWNIATRPDLREKLEMEASTLAEGFKNDDLEILPLLNATINETLRLYTAVPGSLPRIVPASGTMMCGYYLAPGTVVSTQAWTYHRDASLYQNPLEFDPNRYLHDLTGSPNNPKGARATNCAFGAGAYTCLGIHLAWMELRYAVAMFLRECKGAQLAEGMNPLSPSELVNYFVIMSLSSQACRQLRLVLISRPLELWCHAHGATPILFAIQENINT